MCLFVKRTSNRQNYISGTDLLSLMCRYTETEVLLKDRLVGLVVKASALRAEDPGFKSRLRRGNFPGRVYSDLKTGTLVAILPGVWRYRVSAGTGWPGVSIL